MKKLFIIVVSLVVSGLVFAHGSNRGPFKRDNNKYWQQMDQWHDVMHGISVDSENLTDGVTLKITTDSDEVLAKVKGDLKINKQDLSSFFEGVDVALTDTEKGFDVNLTSSDKPTVSRLQNWKNGLLFQYMRSQMNSRFDGRMGFGGHMGGCNGSGRGYGRGMMGGNYGNMGNDSGMMNGYGTGMMGSGQSTM